jgi:hypothetical protein
MAGPDLSEPQASDLRSWDRRLPVVPRWVGVVALVVVLLGVIAWVIADQGTSSAKPKAKHSSSATSGYITFKDPAGVFAGAYPPNWKRYATASPQYVLLVEGPHGASYEVGKTTISAPVDAANLSAALKLTNRIVKSGLDVKLLRKPEEVSLGDLPGILYLYLFRDAATGQMGAHAHYFLFDGKEMITLVFQALPSNYFTTLAPLFTRIASTFHVLPASGG